MLTLKVLGSSSKGNCYVLDDGQEALVIEAGIPTCEILAAVGYDVNRIAGCIVTHEHKDHSRHVGDLLDRYVPVYASTGTAAAINRTKAPFVVSLQPLETISIGRFKVRGFRVQHDAEEPFGYLISHPDSGTILFATDTYYLRYKFAGLSQILIECNYDPLLIKHNVEFGLISESRMERTLKSHMSVVTCVKTLLANDLTEVQNIVLIHLSDENSNEAEFVKRVSGLTGKNTYAARKGLKLELSKYPF